MPEDSPVSLEVERRGDVHFVAPHGRIGEIEAHYFQRELLALVDQGAMKLIVDLSDVPFITSTTLGALMVVHKRIRPQGGYLRIVGPQPLVEHILEITKLVKLFGNYRTAQQAVSAG